jgi:hypothetical protein
LVVRSFASPITIFDGAVITIQRVRQHHATHGPRNAAEVKALREHHRGWPG